MPDTDVPHVESAVSEEAARVALQIAHVELKIKEAKLGQKDRPWLSAISNPTTLLAVITIITTLQAAFFAYSQFANAKEIRLENEDNAERELIAKAIIDNKGDPTGMQKEINLYMQEQLLPFYARNYHPGQCGSPISAQASDTKPASLHVTNLPDSQSDQARGLIPQH